jgi:hypothetical protein
MPTPYETDLDYLAKQNPGVPRADLEAALREKYAARGAAPVNEPATPPESPAPGQAPASAQGPAMTALRYAGHLIPPSPTALFDPYKALRGQDQGGTLRERITANQADLARSAPGLIPNPWISAPASAAGETVAQALEGKAEPDYGQIALAGATPVVAAGAVRAARGVARSATRTVTPLFERAQGKAQDAARAVAEEMTPDVASRPLFQAAAAAGRDRIPVSGIADAVEGVNRTLPKVTTATGARVPNPISGDLTLGMQHAQNIENNVRVRVGPGGTQPYIKLEDLMALRADLSASYSKSKQVQALYGGILKDLEAAAQGGGVGAQAAKEALTSFKGELGVQKWTELVADATKPTYLGGGMALQMRKLEGDFAKQLPELKKLLEPNDIALMQSFVDKFRSLPPEQAFGAYNFARAFVGRAVAGGMVGAGAVSAGAAPVVAGIAGVLGPELILNMKAAARNPAAANMIATQIANAARRAAAPEAAPAGME